MVAKDSLNKKQEEPAFVGQRQTAFRMSARTAMEFIPTQDGEEAGLCVRANDENHYEVGVERFQGKTQIFVRNRVKEKSYTLAQVPFEKNKLQLEISANESQYQFAWSISPVEACSFRMALAPA